VENGSKAIEGQTVLARGDAATVLETAEHALDAVPVAVEELGMSKCTNDGTVPQDGS
jgi:hypothetical protein